MQVYDKEHPVNCRCSHLYTLQLFLGLVGMVAAWHDNGNCSA